MPKVLTPPQPKKGEGHPLCVFYNCPTMTGYFIFTHSYFILHYNLNFISKFFLAHQNFPHWAQCSDWTLGRTAHLHRAVSDFYHVLMIVSWIFYFASLIISLFLDIIYVFYKAFNILITLIFFSPC
jgi:hypothetical protein